MSRWSAFLVSLRTGGGRIFVSMTCLFLFSGLGALFVYNPPATESKFAESAGGALIALIPLFAGILAGSVRGDRGSSNGNANGGDAT